LVQAVWESAGECNGINQINCETNKPSNLSDLVFLFRVKFKPCADPCSFGRDCNRTFGAR